MYRNLARCNDVHMFGLPVRCRPLLRYRKEKVGYLAAFPRLRDSSAIQAEQPDTLIATILRGDAVPATDADLTGLAMPAFDKRLDDNDIAALTTYIRQAWGNRAGAVSSNHVKDLREKLHRNPN